jgi:hypothetical protein
MISISTKGFTFLVGPDLRWSVVGFHGVQVSSGVFFWPYGCSLQLPGLPGGEVVDTHASPCRDCFMGSFLGGDVFPHRRGGAHWPVDWSCQPRGHGLPIRRRPFLSLFIGGGAHQEEEASRGVVI